MSRAKYGTTASWAKDEVVHDCIMKKHGGYEGQKIAEKYVENIFGSNCSLSYLRKRLDDLHLKPDRISKRKKTMLIFWIYDNKELVEEAIAMEKGQGKEQSCVSMSDENFFDSFNDDEVSFDLVV